VPGCLSRVDYHFLTAVFFLEFEARPLYSLNVPNGPREEGVFLEVWCDLMKAELRTAREKFAKSRREGANERQWLYTQSCLEECSSSLEIISRLVPKERIFLKSSRFQISRLTVGGRRVLHSMPDQLSSPNISDGARFDNLGRAERVERENR
jgi:hypothetical protein